MTLDSDEIADLQAALERNRRRGNGEQRAKTPVKIIESDWSWAVVSSGTPGHTRKMHIPNEDAYPDYEPLCGYSLADYREWIPKMENEWLESWEWCESCRRYYSRG